jgi:DNA transformation protein and related proteins
MLALAGVHSVAELRKLGSARAYLKVQSTGCRPSLNLLWSLEGALTATHWLKVARFERTRLLLEVDDLKNRLASQHP